MRPPAKFYANSMNKKTHSFFVFTHQLLICTETKIPPLLQEATWNKRTANGPSQNQRSAFFNSFVTLSVGCAPTESQYLVLSKSSSMCFAGFCFFSHGFSGGAIGL